ncbi:sigma-54-dependent transcriptional regulator family protein [Limimaricola litoreus]|uniref:GAF domain-containing protein n=1 Tax=Limimaricola litoreus TaxID=2955316 RepID=A0A9X2JNI9_9RHOB|nr:GAF domain-containing protein [Limimaricola litoreus]MCP1167699.1 GAF domain-containing protein [Limimaricola litoreus]
MTAGTTDLRRREEIAASWERCERQHKLTRDAARPILLLQASEIAPRLKRIVERTGGRQGFFRQLASVAGDGKRCLVVTDAEGVLVRLETAGRDRDAEDWNGIALGSCWDERIAGTNGVSMALRAGRAYTVGGADHFYARLRAFACTGAPIFDAEGALVGSVNLVTFDRGSATDHHLARQFLETAAERIQRRLFEQRFADSLLVAVSSGAHGRPLSGGGLVAVDEAGIILGATTAVDRIVGDCAPRGLKGQPFQAVFDLESEALATVPERVLSMPIAKGAMLNLSALLPGRANRVRRPIPPATAPQRRRLSLSLRQLATGCKVMAACCAEAEMLFRTGVPFLIDGETGTGKSALIAALVGNAPLLKVDCDTLNGAETGIEALQSLLSQARVLSLLAEAAQAPATVVFDNIVEMPPKTQSSCAGSWTRWKRRRLASASRSRSWWP